MNSVRFKLNIDGLRDVMKSDGMQQHLQSVGGIVRSAAGYGYDNRVVMGKYEAIGQVFPHSAKAAKDNSQNNTLLKSLSSVGLPMTKE